MPEPDMPALTFVGADDAAACDPVTGVCAVPGSGEETQAPSAEHDRAVSVARRDGPRTPSGQ